MALAASACGGNSSEDSTTAPKELVETSPAATGELDTLTWDLPNGEPTSLDYALSADYSPDTVVSNLCDSLLRLNPDFSYSPNLATSWEYSPDRLTLTFKLRTDVTFWDGTPLTSEDVAYSLNRSADPQTSYNSVFFERVKSIRSDGPSRVVVTFKTPDELFVKEMATVAGSISEKSFTEAAGSKYGTAEGGVMCSGPFVLDKWTPGRNITMTANENYWNGEVTPLAKNVTLEFISDSSNMVQALESGEVQGTFEVPEIALPSLSSGDSGTVYHGPSLAIYMLMPNGTPAGSDPKVREALRMIIDRQALVDGVLHGAAVPNYTLLPKTSWDPTAASVYQNALDTLDVPKSADPEGAKEVLAGTDITDITIGVGAGAQTDIDAATLIQQEAADVGLNVTIKQLQPIQLSNAFYEPHAREGLDFIVTRGFLDVADPLDYLGLFVLPDSLFNWTGFDNKRVTSDVAQAFQTFDDEKRAGLITDAQAIYEANNIVIPIAALHTSVYMNDEITGAPTSFAYMFMPNLATVGAK